jgi:CHAT domain-containing protein
MIRKLFFIVLFPMIVFSQNQNDLINYHIQNGNFDKVITLMSSEKDHNRLINFAVALFNESLFETSISFFIEALKIGDKTLKVEEKNGIYNYIGISFEELGKFEYAKKYYKLGINITNSFSETNQLSYILLSNLQFELGENQEAINTLNGVLNKINKNIGKKNIFYLNALEHLCVIYLNNNLSDEVIDSFDSLIFISKDIHGENSFEYFKRLSLKINFLIKQNKFKDAEIESDKLIVKYLNHAEKDYLNLSLKYNQYATIQQGLYKFDSAEKYFLKGIDLIVSQYGKENPYYILFISNLGNLYLENDNYDNAEKYFLEALELKQQINDINTSSIYHNLAALLMKKNICSLAENYQLKSIKSVTNKSSEKYINNLLGLIVINNCLKNNVKENNYLSELIQLNTDEIKSYVDFMTFEDLNVILEKKSYQKSFALSFLENYSSQFKTFNLIYFEYDLILRNLIMSNYINLKKNISSSDNFQIIETFKKYTELKRYLNKLKQGDFNLPDNELLNLQKELSTLEKYLITNFKEISNYKKYEQIKFNNLTNTLKENELIIVTSDYNRYEYNKFKGFRYGAFIIRDNSKFPKYIPLFQENDIIALFEQNKNHPVSSIIDKQYLNKQLSELILKPLENELEGISTIYLSLSGVTHQINLAALPVDENQTFGEKYKVHILNSPSELIDYKPLILDKKNKLDIILYGGIDYDKKTTSNKKLEVKEEVIINEDEELMALQTRSGNSSFGYLSGTKNEIYTIQNLAKSNDYKTIIFEDRNATEESIKSLDGRTTPFVLHIATHGFFFPDPVIEMSNDKLLFEVKSKVFKTSDDPMMRSGLVFSGANKTWGKPNAHQSGEDGILTASEISNLDLSACQLVVLSACETGLGEIKGSEGVFGLQRAFKMAGVKNIIMSLWKVPDAQTSELFQIFYEECFKGKTIHDAFKTAQNKMKAKYSPYYWAGFVLLE